MAVLTNEKYVRRDYNNNIVTVPSKEVTQEESCLSYRIFNQEYQRRDKDCNPPTAPKKQPDLLNGWNGDYVRVYIGNKPLVTSQQLVEQTIYTPTDKDNVAKTFLCFVDPPLGFTVGSFDSIIMEQDQNYYFITENTNEKV